MYCGRLLVSIFRNSKYAVKQHSARCRLTKVKDISDGLKFYCSSSSDDVVKENKPFSCYPIPDRSILPQDIQEYMEEVETKTGFMPNVLSTLSYRPEEFKAFFDYYDILMNKETGSLTKAERELIVVATSAANNCLYCIVSHSALHRIYSQNKYKADQTAINWESAELSPRERAIVKFALDVSNCKTLSEKDFDALEQHDLSRDDAWDIGAIAAFFALSNRMAFLTSMKPNEEFYLMGRVKKPKEEKKGNEK